MLLTIVTIGHSNFIEISNTCQSVNHQSLKPHEHILVLSGLSDTERVKLRELFSASYRKFVFDQDNSLYNAMNIGMRTALGDSVLFLNSGDIFFNEESIEVINDNFVLGKCLVGRSLQVYQDLCFVRPGLKHIQQLRKWPGHQGFVAPVESNPDHRLYFNESKPISADQFWMKDCMDKYDAVITAEIVARMYLGGISNAPSINGIVLMIRSGQFLVAAKIIIKLLIAMFVPRRQYYKLLSRVKGFDVCYAIKSK